MSDPDPADPTVRLAATTAMLTCANGSGVDRYPFHKDSSGADRRDRPALLVSYVYLKPFLANRHRYHYRDWAMDSGAYSAHNSGTAIDIVRYAETCHRLMREDPTLTEVFSLDVIGDWRASLRNTEWLWSRGIPAIPTFHPGEPWSALVGMAKDYPKIALGGVVGWAQKRKVEHVGQCFARVWPKKVHGLGMSSERLLMAFPFHSVDATNWEIGPCKFGRWNAYGDMSVRGSRQNLRVEVEWYLALERRVRQRWKKEMARLDAADSPSPTLRMAMADKGQEARFNGAFEGPVVRLAVQQANDAQIARSGLTSPSSAQRSGGGLAGLTVRLAYAETGREAASRIDSALGKPDPRP